MLLYSVYFNIFICLTSWLVAACGKCPHRANGAELVISSSGNLMHQQQLIRQIFASTSNALGNGLVPICIEEECDSYLLAGNKL